MADKGVGTSQWLIVLIPPRESFAEDATESERALIARHFEYLSGLAEQGIVQLAGRTLDAPPMGLVILNAADADAARAIAAADPAVEGGVFSADVRPYRVAIGPLAE